MPQQQDALTARLERFYDAVPRGDARVETVGPFTLFVPEPGGFPYYARPALGTASFAEREVRAVRDRQCELGLPEAFEWQFAATPALADVLRDSGLSVHEHPLQVLDGAVRIPAPAPDVELTELHPAASDDDLRTALAAADVGFGHGGTAVGDTGTEALQDARAKVGDEAVARCRRRLAEGRARMVVAGLDGTTVAVASAQLAEDAAEIVGVATLPAYRRRGLGAAVTAGAVAAAGAHTTFLSASDDDVARMYARLGFHRVGTAGIASAR